MFCKREVVLTSPPDPSPKGRGEKISPDIMVIPGGEKHPAFPDSLSLLPEGEGKEMRGISEPKTTNNEQKER